MLLTFGTVRTTFCKLILFLVLQSSHQLTYPCNTSALCGCSYKPASLSRIVGGESAGKNTWGWAVALSINIGDGIALCGGAILSSSWIITAAHCISDVDTSEITVFAGSNTLFSGQVQFVASIIIHPRYDNDTNVNDIALIRLSSPLTMTNAVKTICVPSVNSSTLDAGEWPPANSNVCYFIRLCHR